MSRVRKVARNPKRTELIKNLSTRVWPFLKVLGAYIIRYILPVIIIGIYLWFLIDLYNSDKTTLLYLHITSFFACLLSYLTASLNNPIKVSPRFILIFLIIFIGTALPEVSRRDRSLRPYLKTADLLFINQNYASAIDAYKVALNLYPSDRYIKRQIASCYLYLGDFDSAITYQLEVVNNEYPSVADMQKMSLYYFLRAYKSTAVSMPTVKPGMTLDWHSVNYQSVYEDKKLGAIAYTTDSQDNKNKRIVGQRALSQEVFIDLKKSEDYALRIIGLEKHNKEALTLLSRINMIKANYERALFFGYLVLELDQNNIENYDFLIDLYSDILRVPYLVTGNKEYLNTIPHYDLIDKYLSEIESKRQVAKERNGPKKFFPDSAAILSRILMLNERASRLDSGFIRGYIVILNYSVELFLDKNLTDANAFFLHEQKRAILYNMINFSKILINIAPNKHFGYTYLSQAHLFSGDIESTIKDIDSALRYEPDKDWEIRLRENKVTCLDLLGRKREAIEEAKLILQKDPDNIEMRSFLYKGKRISSVGKNK